MATTKRTELPARQGSMVAWIAALAALLLLIAVWLIASYGLGEDRPWRLSLPSAERELPSMPNPEPMPIPAPRPGV